jgi:CHAT domain-containing protein
MRIVGPLRRYLSERNRRLTNETPDQRQVRLRHAEAAYPAAAAELSKMVLGPLGPLTGIKRILIVSDGALQYIPFEALPAPTVGPVDDRPPLVVNYEIVHLPSVSVIAELRRGGAKTTPSRQVLAVLADPVFDQDDPRVGRKALASNRIAKNTDRANTSVAGLALPVDPENVGREIGVGDNEVLVPRLLFSREEAESILRNVPADRRFAALNFKASRATATAAELSRYRYLHFATHGILNSQHPELSGVVLSLVDEAGRPQDGFLRLHDIYSLRLSAELVVLSACQTGLGREVRGEGLIGLTRGFMYAGAPRVVASLWKVDDAATAELMSRFYRGILKENRTPAAALHNAQLEMWRQPNWRRSPYYWAAFVLQGDWK